MSQRKPLAIGIDVGATHFRVAVHAYGNKGKSFKLIESDMGKGQTPCYARLDGEHEWTIGEKAMHSAHQETARTVFFIKRLLGHSIGEVVNHECLPFISGEDMRRRKIGLLEPCTNTTRSISPIEIYSEFLRKARENAEFKLEQDSIEDVVITAPDTFTHEQKETIRSAAKIAGLRVLLITSDTSAAASFYSVDMDPGTQKSILIFDLGGGSFKLSTWHIERDERTTKKKCLTRGGDHNLGGFDFDSAIVRHVLKMLPSELSELVKQDKAKMWHLLDTCKKAREDLTTMEETCLDLSKYEANLQFSFSRTNFKELEDVKALLSIIRKAIDDAISKPTHISEIVTMGGASNMICIQEIIESCCKERKISINRTLDGNETVVFGASYMAFSSNNHAKKFQDGDVTKELGELEMYHVEKEMAAHRERRKLEQNKQDWMNLYVKTIHETQDVVKKLKNRADFDEQCQKNIKWEKENPHAPIRQIINAFESAKALKERVAKQQLDECIKNATTNSAKDTPRESECNCIQNVTYDLQELKTRLCPQECIIKVCNYGFKKENKEMFTCKSIRLPNIFLCLQVCVYGYGKGENSHMTLNILTCYCEENQTSCKISVLNQKEDAGHYEYVAQLKYEEGKQNYLLIEEFIDNNTLSNYIEDNSIFLKFELLKPWLRPGRVMI